MSLFRLLGLAENSPSASSNFSRRSFLRGGAAVAATATALPMIPFVSASAMSSSGVSVTKVYGEYVAAQTGTTYAALRQSSAFRNSAFQVAKAWRTKPLEIQTQVLTSSFPPSSVTSTLSAEFASGGEMYQVLNSGGVSLHSFLEPPVLGNRVSGRLGDLAIRDPREVAREAIAFRNRVSRIVKNAPQRIMDNHEIMSELRKQRMFISRAKAGIPPIERLPGRIDDWVRVLELRLNELNQRREKEELLLRGRLRDRVLMAERKIDFRPIFFSEKNTAPSEKSNSNRIRDLALSE